MKDISSGFVFSKENELIMLKFQAVCFALFISLFTLCGLICLNLSWILKYMPAWTPFYDGYSSDPESGFVRLLIYKRPVAKKSQLKHVKNHSIVGRDLNQKKRCFDLNFMYFFFQREKPLHNALNSPRFIAFLNVPVEPYLLKVLQSDF